MKSSKTLRVIIVSLRGAQRLLNARRMFVFLRDFELPNLQVDANLTFIVCDRVANESRVFERKTETYSVPVRFLFSL